jgi:hypothetical protein
MEQQKKASAVTKRPQARKLITDKLRYIANSRGLKMNEVWDAIVGPVVQAEFEACGGVPNKSPARRG